MANDIGLTAAEAAFVLDEPVRRLRRELDTGPARGRLTARHGRSVRMLDRTDLVYLLAARALHESLTRKGREALYAALKECRGDLTGPVRFSGLDLDLAPFIDALDEGLRRLRALNDTVAMREDGEPVVKGTTIEVHRIAALCEAGFSADDVLADFPSLTREQVVAACAYATTHPKPGRPYPATTAKRALRDAGLDALDEVFDGHAAAE